jgi:hypothetical protein
MAVSSYFLKLFTRGRYVTSRSIAQSEATSDDPQRKHADRERFAVAAVAFCCRYDKGFRDHFLKIIANLKEGDVDKIEVEPERWGDLVLEGKQDVVVCEFKLQALLGTHQDPNAEGRVFTTTGYGKEILTKYRGTGKRLYYVIVGKDVAPGATTDRIQCRSVQWLDFISRTRRETSLERDLFDCLGTLGAPILLSRHMKKTAPTKEASGALEIYQLLTLAAGSIRPGGSNSGPDCIGLNLLSSRSAINGSPHRTLIDKVDPLGRYLGWIGYERREEFERQLCLSVWFHCSSKGKKLVQKRLVPLERANKGKILTEENNVGFLQPAASQTDHKKWIETVLEL